MTFCNVLSFYLCMYKMHPVAENFYMMFRLIEKSCLSTFLKLKIIISEQQLYYYRKVDLIFICNLLFTIASMLLFNIRTFGRVVLDSRKKVANIEGLEGKFHFCTFSSRLLH